jgi:hypothetical protein
VGVGHQSVCRAVFHVEGWSGGRQDLFFAVIQLAVMSAESVWPPHGAHERPLTQTVAT